MTDTFDRVRELIVEHLFVAPEQVTASALFIDDLGTDSLDMVELQIAAEEVFGVELSDDDVYEATTVGKLVALIDREIAK